MPVALANDHELNPGVDKPVGDKDDSVVAGSTGDAPRYIARLGYTTNVARAVDRLEAIRADEQAAMTASADRTWREQQARAWGSCHAAITSALNTFAGEVRVDRRVSSDLRAIERTAQRVDQRVGAQ